MIARALGNALVAPVIAYVPEGSLRAAVGPHALSGHDHRAAGRLPQGARIGGAQPPPARVSATSSCWASPATTRGDNATVARELNREWMAAPVRVHAIDEYYRACRPSVRASVEGPRLRRRGDRPARRARRHVADARDRPAARADRPHAARRPARRGRCRASPAIRGARRAELGQVGVDAIVAQTVAADPHRRRPSLMPRRGSAVPLASTPTRIHPAPPGALVKFDCLARPLAAAVAVLSCAALPASAQTPTRAPATSPPPAVATVPGMPPVPDAANLYSETAADKMSPAVAGDLPRVYVPHIQSNDVYVIDPATFKVSTSSRSASTRSTWCRRGTCARCGSRTTPRTRTDGSVTPDRPEDRQAGQADRRRRPVQHVFLRRTASRRSSSPRR